MLGVRYPHKCPSSHGYFVEESYAGVICSFKKIEKEEKKKIEEEEKKKIEGNWYNDISDQEGKKTHILVKNAGL